MLAHLSVMATLAMTVLAQQVQVTDLTQSISVSGGFGGQSTCRISARLDRGGEPVVVNAAETCDQFQFGGITEPKWLEFPEANGLRVRFGCDVQSGQCGNEFQIRVEADGGAFCGQGVTPIKQCPGIDFRRGLSMVARQDNPTETAPDQCYEDILLSDC